MIAKKGYLVLNTARASVVGNASHIHVTVYSSKEQAMDFIHTQNNPSDWQIETIRVEGF